MTVYCNMDKDEKFSVIGLAKALVEGVISVEDVGELAQYLSVYYQTHSKEEGLK